jgi:predicted nucleic acid-binding protein
MNIITDTNIFLAVVLNEPEKERIIEQTSNCKLLSPEILPYEIGNALSAIVKRKQLTIEQALQAIELADAIPVRLVQPDIKSSLELALRFNIYAYDAYFLQSALSLNCPLLTLDKKMKEVAKQLNIVVLE